MGNDTLAQRRPSTRVKARLVPLPRESRHVARCGRCGQFLWTVEDGQQLVPSWLKDLRAGWRFDPDGRIWRPTETHLAQRAAASARVKAGTATPEDRLRLELSSFGRRRSRSGHYEESSIRKGHAFAGARFAISPPEGSRFGATAELPVAIQCPRCGSENELEDPDPPQS